MGKDGDFMGFFSCPFYYPVIPSKRKIRGKTLIFLIYSLNFVFDLTKIKWGSIGIRWDDYGEIMGSALVTKWKIAGE